MKPRGNIVVFLFVFGLLSGCGKGTGFPDIPATMSADSKNAPWPGFLPVEQILLASREDLILDDATIQAMRYRVAALRRRAARLRAPVISQRDKSKMQSTVRRHTRLTTAALATPKEFN